MIFMISTRSANSTEGKGLDRPQAGRDCYRSTPLLPSTLFSEASSFYVIGDKPVIPGVSLVFERQKKISGGRVQEARYVI